MKKKILKIMALMIIVILFCSCKKEQSLKKEGLKEGDYLKVGEASYIKTNNDVAYIKEVLKDAGIDTSRIDVFLSHVEQFNNVVEEKIPDGKLKISELSQYDAYELQDMWMEIYPDFMGYNCRITSYGLMGDFIDVTNVVNNTEEELMFDISSLKEDSSVLVNKDTIEKFSTLFSIISTKNTTDVKKHVEKIQQSWDEKGISFAKDSSVSMISVFLHDKWDDGNELMIGHVGVLIEVQKDRLLFVEKVAFQEPYQMICFENREELNDYLMEKYDVGSSVETARAFILENDKLLEGYRLNQNNLYDKDENTEKGDVSSDDELAGESKEENSEEKYSKITATIEEIKDFMFIIIDEEGESYTMDFEEKPKGLESVSVGDKVLIKYVGELSQVDPFVGQIISIEKIKFIS